MIKLRAEWHYKCHGCGIELAVDYPNGLQGFCPCPWCGCISDLSVCADGQEVRSFLAGAVKEIEEAANNKIPIKS